MKTSTARLAAQLIPATVHELEWSLTPNPVSKNGKFIKKSQHPLSPGRQPVNFLKRTYRTRLGEAANPGACHEGLYGYRELPPTGPFSSSVPGAISLLGAASPR